MPLTYTDQVKIRTAEVNRLRVLAQSAGCRSPFKQAAWMRPRLIYKGYHVGDIVAVVGHGDARALLASFLEDPVGGAVLDRPIGGLRYWNVRDLRRVTPWPK